MELWIARSRAGTKRRRKFWRKVITPSRIRRIHTPSPSVVTRVFDRAFTIAKQWLSCIFSWIAWIGVTIDHQISITAIQGFHRHCQPNLCRFTGLTRFLLPDRTHQSTKTPGNQGHSPNRQDEAKDNDEGEGEALISTLLRARTISPLHKYPPLYSISRSENLL